jgi:hypothetical protein
VACDSNTNVESCSSDAASMAIGCKVNNYLNAGVCTACNNNAA